MRYWPLDVGLPIGQVMATEEPLLLDASTLQFFDGRCLHETEGFCGVRYSLVFFVIRGADKADSETRRQLQQDGASCKLWSAPQEVPRAWD